MRVEHEKIELYWMGRESVVYDAGDSASPRVGDLAISTVCLLAPWAPLGGNLRAA